MSSRTITLTSTRPSTIPVPTLTRNPDPDEALERCEGKANCSVLITRSAFTSTSSARSIVPTSSTETPSLTVTATADQSPLPSRHLHRHQHQKGSMQTPFVIFVLVVASFAGLVLLISLIRFSYSYFRTPARDRIALFISRHRLQREMEQRTREDRRNRRWWRGSLQEPPPPPYLHPPNYQGDQVEEARLLNPGVSSPRAAWHASHASLSLSYASSFRDSHLGSAMEVQSSLSSGYVIEPSIPEPAHSHHRHSPSHSGSEGSQDGRHSPESSYHSLP